MDGQSKHWAELRRIGRVAAMRRAIAAVAHSVGTPLNVITGRAALIASGGTDVEKSARIIEQEVEVLAERLRRMLDFFRSQANGLELTDCSALANDLAELYRSVAASLQIEIDLDVRPDVTFELRRSAFELVFSGLLELGLSVGRAGDRIRLGLVRVASQNGPILTLDAEYERPVVTPEMLSPAREPWELGDGDLERAALVAELRGLCRENAARLELRATDPPGRVLSIHWPTF
jgi:two-component system NtrC family sensor kinase